MPKVTPVHLSPKNFEKMRVSYAFQLFSNDVVKALRLYKELLTSQYEATEPTTSQEDQPTDQSDDIATWSNWSVTQY
ncbi:hypothetical protein JTE90_003490 [Oedothorax gibbosus]|uniref:Transposable element P transposase-like GTP-binding insertion domain-containing protein n=1 Tax=Oedothorax gibbosus TaxID=931172 RepID=A0AAV6UEA7_9ARAC|nr:hypothetical protein JTE90_003490 [Oedothorax gibbosus]